MSAKRKGLLMTGEIALLQGVSAARVKQLWTQFRVSGLTPALKRPNRHSGDLPAQMRARVVEACLERRVGARLVESILKNEGARGLP